MWYKKPGTLDYNKPIGCKNNSNNEILILIPQISKASGYDVVGYNWLNVSSGEYDSCCFYASVDAAFESRSPYEMFNLTIDIAK